MTIGELSAATGVPASTLRYWERIQVLPRAARVSGQRRYDHQARYMVTVLQLAKACGFSLVEMRRLISGFRKETHASERWRVSIGEHLESLERQLAQLHAMRTLMQRLQHCKCVDLEDCGRLASPLLQPKDASVDS